MSPNLDHSKIARSKIDASLETQSILVTCGTGGVGKTTVSAALAVRAACLGKKAVVITIDPAKRLATSLGLSDIGDQATDLTPALNAILLQKGQAPVPDSGSLHAIMPDTRETFEGFIRSLTSNEAVAKRVIQNPIFQIFSREFSGSNEYMAMQRLLGLHREKQFDLIILDTPPSRNTLALLDAPKLLARFFDERLIRWLVLPANKLVSAGMRKALGLLEKLTGAAFMSHLFEFASALFEVRVQFSANLSKITDLLSERTTSFLLVAAPSRDTAPDAVHFVQTVQEHQFHFEGMIVNRRLSHLGPVQSQMISDAPLPHQKEALDVLAGLQAREEAAMADLGKRLESFASNQQHSRPLCLSLPELARDVHSLSDLVEISRAFETFNPA